MATGTLADRRARADVGGDQARRAAPWWVLGGILVACAALRFAVLASIVGRLDGDEGANGIATQLLLQGRFPLTVPDTRAYFGSLEQYLQAPFLAFDPTSPFLLRVAQVLLSVGSCWLVALLARRCLDHPWAGEIAAALFTVGPFFSVAWSFKNRTYPSPLFLGLAGLLLAFGQRPRERRSWLYAVGFGLVCGLGFWTNWTSAFLLLPAGVWWLGAIRGRRRTLIPLAAAGFAVGAFPFALAARTGRLPTILDRAVADSSIRERLDALFGSVLGMFVGVRRSPPAGVDVPLLPDPLPTIVVAVLVLAIVGAVLYRWRTMLRLVTLRPGARPADVLLLAALLTPPLYVVSEFAFLRQEPRYLFVLYGLLPLGLTALVPKRRVAGAVVAGVLLTLVAATTVDGLVTTFRTDGLAPDNRLSRVQSEDLPAVVDALEQEGERYVWGGFWTAHPLQFVAGDRLVVGSWEAPRFPETYREVRAAANPAFVAPTGRDADELAAALTAAGATYRTREVESFTLFLDVTPPVQPSRYGVGADRIGLRRADR
jgi:4-amino-4-deoxy-L-arabinose transferase-like glycosyltransferase